VRRADRGDPAAAGDPGPGGGRPQSLGAGELRVAAAPARLAIHGLGSCVAVFLYDPGERIGGLAHILLPAPPPGAGDPGPGRAGRYATTAIEILVAETLRRGARSAALLAKVTGGSRMFACDSGSQRATVGDKNVEAALAVLAALRVPVAGSDVGGASGRNVVADLEDGRLIITTIRGLPRVV
jgi:chemotaxis protein CheD